MERIPDSRPLPADRTVDIVRVWILALTEVEGQIGSRFARVEA